MIKDLYFDCRYIRVGHHDGISRFSAGLFTALVKLVDVTAVISDLRQLDKLPTGTKFVKVSSPTSIIEPLVALQLNRVGAKVVFSPMQTIGSFGRKFKLVLTVHDLIYYRHLAPPPGFALPIRVLWRLYHLVFWPQRLLLNRSDAVATVSETTKELIAKHNLTKRPVRVVYNAAEDESEIKIPTARPTSAQRLVYMGSFMDYKNVEVLIKGMAELAGFELHLLSRISSERQIELESLVPNGATVVFHNGVTDHEYQELLTGAVALVSGSQDEGFGIPLVEAMNRGVPIVVSDIEIFREIGGEAGIYFNQNDPKSFAAAVMSISEDRAWLQRSIAGQKQALKFSWTKSAEALLETLKQI
jgi:glycosyltransferase involved in cell wall biosynthesis